jgi:hypothetical protein
MLGGLFWPGWSRRPGSSCPLLRQPCMVVAPPAIWRAAAGHWKVVASRLARKGSPEMATGSRWKAATRHLARKGSPEMVKMGGATSVGVKGREQRE